MRTTVLHTGVQPTTASCNPAGSPYEGYVPGFLGDLKDYNGTIGTKFDTAGWDSDVSLTFGGNEQMYTVTNSVNRAVEEKSRLVSLCQSTVKRALTQVVLSFLMLF